MSFAESLTKYEESGGGYEVVPLGNYELRVGGIELKNTKAGTGSYLNFKIIVVGPSSKRRTFFQKFNWTNLNPDAEKIGRGQARAIFRAMGYADFTSHPQCAKTHTELRTLPGDIYDALSYMVNNHRSFTADVIIEKSNQYGDSNEIVRPMYTGGMNAGTGVRQDAQSTPYAQSIDQLGETMGNSGLRQDPPPPSNVPF